MMQRREGLATLLVLAAVACGGGMSGEGGTGGVASGATSGSTGGTDDCPDGSETCPCYGNGTCDAGLTCASGLCVEFVESSGGTGGAPTGGRGGGSPATGGAPTGGIGGGGTSSLGGAPTGGTGGAIGGRAAGGATPGGSSSTGGSVSSGGTGGSTAAGGATPGGSSSTGGSVSSGGTGGSTTGEEILYDFASDDAGVEILDYDGSEVDGIQYANVGSANDREVYMGLDPATSAPTATWSDEDGYDEQPGLIELEVPFNGYDQAVDLEWIFDAPMDLSGTVILARVMVVDGFVTGEGAAGGGTIFAKAGEDWVYGRGGWYNLVQDDYGEWVEFEFEFDSPDYMYDDFDPTSIRAIGVEISTGGAIGDTLPTDAIVYVDHITVLAL